MHNGMPSETLLHCKRLATASMFTCKRAPFLMKRENMALEIKHSCVGSITAFSWTSTHIPLWGMSFHMLLQIIFAFKCFLAYFTSYLLLMGFSHMFQKVCPCFCHKGTFFLTYITLMDLPVPFEPAGRSEVLSTSFMGTLKQRFVGVLALMDFQLLMLPKGLLTTFKTAYILLLLIFMFALKMFPQV